VEKAKFEPGTMIVEFPVAGDDKVPTEKEVSLEQKIDLAIVLQEYWADNQVSCTATFDPDTERDKIFEILKDSEHTLKSISFLPMLEEGAYHQMPYEAITKAQYEEMISNLTFIEWHKDTTHDQQDTFCDGLVCELPGLKAIKENVNLQVVDISNPVTLSVIN
jgi:ribonucleoside-triphosphate reductase (thioredoxin)